MSMLTVLAGGIGRGATSGASAASAPASQADSSQSFDGAMDDAATEFAGWSSSPTAEVPNSGLPALVDGQNWATHDHSAPRAGADAARLSLASSIAAASAVGLESVGGQVEEHPQARGHEVGGSGKPDGVGGAGAAPAGAPAVASAGPRPQGQFAELPTLGLPRAEGGPTWATGGVVKAVGGSHPAGSASSPGGVDTALAGEAQAASSAAALKTASSEAELPSLGLAGDGEGPKLATRAAGGAGTAAAATPGAETPEHGQLAEAVAPKWASGGADATGTASTARDTLAAGSSAAVSTSTAPSTGVGLAPVAPAAAASVSQASPAPAPAPAPAQAPVPQDFSAQLARPIANIRSAGAGEHVITVNVTPENLGPVTVRAHVGADGMRIELLAPSEAGREALKAILGDLRRDLAGLGVATPSLGAGGQSGQPGNATLSLGDNQGQGAQTQGGRDGDAAPARNPGAAPSSHADASAPELTHDRGIRGLATGIDVLA